MKVRILGPLDVDGGAMLVTFESLAEADVFRILMSYDVTLPREVREQVERSTTARRLSVDFVRNMMSMFHTEITRASPQHEEP